MTMPAELIAANSGACKFPTFAHVITNSFSRVSFISEIAKFPVLKVHLAGYYLLDDFLIEFEAGVGQTIFVLCSRRFA